MKHKWLLGAGILSVILTGCTDDAPANRNPTSPERTKNTQSTERIIESSPSEAQPSIPATLTTQEREQTEITLPDEWFINGWTVGVLFSTVVDRLPTDAELDNSFMEYSLKSENLDLYFTWGGILNYIFTNEAGKGLNTILNVGDDEQKIEQALGKPKERSTTNDGYLAYLYSFDDYDITIYAKENSIQGMAMQLTGSPPADNSKRIEEYFDRYFSEMNPVETDRDQTDETQATSVKFATRSELIELRDDFFKRYKDLLNIIVDDSSDTDKIITVFSDIDSYQVELDLEDASYRWSSNDETLGRLVSEFVEAVLDMQMWQVLKNNADDNQSRTNAAYQIIEASTKAHNANQKILILLHTAK